MSEYTEVVGADRTKMTTAGLRVDVPQPWPPTGPEKAEQRIAALEQELAAQGRELAETRLHVAILIARVESLEQAAERTV